MIKVTVSKKRVKETGSRPPYKHAHLKTICLFHNQNIFCGYSKEPSHLDGSFEH